MSDTATLVDPDHDMVERLIALHPPANTEVASMMDEVRSQFRALAHHVVDTVPRTPDRAIALRSIHRACMDTIAAIACNQ